MSDGSEKCQRCSSTRVASLSAKCSDCCRVGMVNSERTHDGYVPWDMGIGGGDYIVIAWCLDCGQIQDDEYSGEPAFPRPPSKMEAM